MKFLFIGLLWWPIAGFAHGYHGGAGLDGLFAELAADGLLLHSRPAGSGSFVLANGKRYALDSKFWASAASFLDHDSPALSRFTYGQRVRARLKEFSEASFWISLGARGAESFIRYGPFTFTVIATAEVLHEFLMPGLPICFAVQTGCLIFTQQLRELWTGARYRQAGEGGLGERMATTRRVLRGKYEFWRAMGAVLRDDPQLSATRKGGYKKYFRRFTPVEDVLLSSKFWGSLLRSRPTEKETETAAGAFGHCDILDGLFFNCSATEDVAGAGVDSVFLRPLDPEFSIAERVVAAQEQLAYLELTLSVAKGAAYGLIAKPWQYLKLIFHLARTGRVLDDYGFVLRRIAARGAATAHEQTFVEDFVRDYVAYYRDLETHIKDLKASPAAAVAAAGRSGVKDWLGKISRAVSGFRRAGNCATDLRGSSAASY